MNGRIVKALSGFYYVEAADGIHECRARGIFRKDGVWYMVFISMTAGTGYETFLAKSEFANTQISVS